MEPFPTNSTSSKRFLPRYEGFLVPLLTCFICGLTLGAYFPELPCWKPSFILLMGLVLGGLFLASERRWILRASLWLWLLLFGGWYFQQFAFQPGPTDISHQAPQPQVTVSGVLETLQPNHKAFLTVQAINQQAATGRVQVILPKNQPLPEEGSRVELTGDLARPWVAMVPGGFDQTQYLKTFRATAVLHHVQKIQVIEAQPAGPQWALARYVTQVRQHIAQTFKKALPSPQSEILGGIVLGNHAIPVDKTTKKQFAETGLIHLLAASGMNVGIIGFFVFWLLERCRVPFHARMLAAMIAVGGYALLTGLPPSIQRAATMLEIALLLKLFHRQLSPLLLLCLATTLLLAFRPETILSLGFQYSVLTTFGLITMVPPLQSWLGHYITRWLAGLILVPIIAQLWILPLMIFHFNQFPLHSVPLNMLAVALVIPLTNLGFLAGLLSLVYAPLGELLAGLSSPFVTGLYWLAAWGEGQDWAKQTLPSPPEWAIVLSYLFLLAGVLSIHRLKQVSALRKALWVSGGTFICLFIIGCTQWSEHRQNHLVVLPLSYQHSALLLQPQDSHQMTALLPSHLTYPERRNLEQYLRFRNIQTLATVVLWPTPSVHPSAKPVTSLPAQHIFYLSDATQPAHSPVRPLKPNATLQLGTFRLTNRMHYAGELFEIRGPRFCLSGSTQAQARSDCPLTYYQPVFARQGSRLFPQTLFPEHQYYHLQFQSQQLAVSTRFW